MKPLVVLVAGGSCSGKSEFGKWYRNSLLIDLDSFYLPLSNLPHGKDGGYNFDTPDAIGIEECAKAIKELLRKGVTEIPKYSFIQNDRIGTQTIRLKRTTKFIVVEGMYTLYSPLLDLGDIKIFLDTPAEIRVARRMLRDVKRKNRTKQEILSNFVLAEEGYQKYVEPTKKKADLIIPMSMNPIKL